MSVYGMRRLAVALVLGLALAMPAHALDDATIDRWIAAMEDLDAWQEGVEQEIPDAPEADAGGEPDAAEIQRMMARMAQRHAEVEEIIQQHGFDGSGQWAEVSSRIFGAFYAVEVEDARPEMERQQQETLRQIEENPNLTEEQKAQMRRVLQQQMEAMAEMAPDVPEADRRAVRARESELRALFDAGE